jgi:hypothetical protein
MKPDVDQTKPPVSIWTVAKKKLRKALRIISFLIIVFLVAFIFIRYFYTYSEGSRVGLLQKFSRKGMIFKTYEGEMILSSVTGGNNVVIASEKFLFSVADKNLAKCLDSLQGKTVVVYYQQKKAPLPWKGDTPYYIDSVKVR